MENLISALEACAGQFEYYAAAHAEKMQRSAPDCVAYALANEKRVRNLALAESARAAIENARAPVWVLTSALEYFTGLYFEDRHRKLAQKALDDFAQGAPVPDPKDAEIAALKARVAFLERPKPVEHIQD